MTKEEFCIVEAELPINEGKIPKALDTGELPVVLDESSRTPGHFPENATEMDICHDSWPFDWSTAQAADFYFRTLECFQ